MDVQAEVLKLLDQVLNLKGRAGSMTSDTALLGALPEFDSMAVVTLITSLEERFGLAIDDDDLSASNFETVGALTEFVKDRLPA